MALARHLMTAVALSALIFPMPALGRGGPHPGTRHRIDGRADRRERAGHPRRARRHSLAGRAGAGRAWRFRTPSAGPIAGRQATKGRSAGRRRAARTKPGSRIRRGPITRAAGGPGVTIDDFKFVPGTTVVHLGDTITWSNRGPSAHTATARDGSFDTGLLQKGTTGSHTFTHVGSFAYFCQIHPFMHGTIVVLTATPATPTVSAAGAPSHPAPAKPAASSLTRRVAASSPTTGGPTLPVTGGDLPTELSAGLAMVVAGALLRRGAREGLRRRWRHPH
jgi:plastocyanin